MLMSKLQREIIGRCAIGVLGALFLFGAFKCFVAAAIINGDLGQVSADSARTHSGGLALPIGIGIALSLLGAPLTLAAVIPTRWFEKLLGRQRKTTLWEGPEAGEALRRWSDFF
jgi:hypothetical protein